MARIIGTAVWLLAGRHDNTGRHFRRSLRRCAAFSSTRTARCSISRRRGRPSCATWRWRRPAATRRWRRNCLVAGGLDRETGKVRAGSVIGAGTSERHRAPVATRRWTRMPFVGTRGGASTAIFHAHGASRIACRSRAWPRRWPNSTRLGLVMGVATNDSTEAAKACARRHRHRPLPAAYLRLRFGGERAKPAPDLVHAFAEITGLAPAEIVVVGDNVA